MTQHDPDQLRHQGIAGYKPVFYAAMAAGVLYLLLALTGLVGGH